MKKLYLRLKDYSEYLFLAFIVLMGELGSCGFSSSDRVYKIVFLGCALLWALKMCLSGLNPKEISIIFAAFLLWGLVFLRNGEKTFLLTLMAIFGMKNVSKEKVMWYSLVTKAFTTVCIFLLAVTDVIENKYIVNIKFGAKVKNYCFGYSHPNHAFMNLFMMAIVLVVIFKEKMKWYMYLLLTAVFYGAYRLFLCRTGFLLWLLLVFAVFVYRFLQKWYGSDVFLRLMHAVPGVMLFMTFFLAFLFKKKVGIVRELNSLLNARISDVATRMGRVKTSFIGLQTARSFDNGYFHLVYNYGFIITILFVVLLSGAIYYFAKRNMGYEAIALMVLSVFLYMEFAVLSPVWNTLLILLGYVFFERINEKKKGKELENG